MKNATFIVREANANSNSFLYKNCLDRQHDLRPCPGHLSRDIIRVFIAPWICSYWVFARENNELDIQTIFARHFDNVVIKATFSPNHCTAHVLVSLSENHVIYMYIDSKKKFLTEIDLIEKTRLDESERLDHVF